jgi:drug/metabolite transporter (DMT)-like permease
MSFALLVPIFGVLGAVLLLGESLSVFTVLGGIAVLAGLWLVQHRAPAKAAAPLRSAARPALDAR